MYEKDGEKYFIVDSHIHYWDASRENWKPGAEEYAKGWIDCFYGYHQPFAYSSAPGFQFRSTGRSRSRRGPR